MLLRRALGRSLGRALGAGGLANNSQPPAVFPFQMATASGLGMGAEMSGENITGTQGEPISVSRTTTAYGTKADGTLVSVGISRPRVVSVGGVLSLFVEGDGATNICLHSSDLTQAAWTKTSMTTAFTATHPDPTRLCTTCTATAGNATVTQALAFSSVRKGNSVYLRRRTGVGTVEVTRDGSAWIDVTAALSASWTRITPATHAGFSTSTAVTTATLGIRIVTSGDAVDVAGFQNETWVGSGIPGASSLVETGAASVARTSEIVTVTLPFLPATAAWCVRMKATPLGLWTQLNQTGAGLAVLGTYANSSPTRWWAFYLGNSANVIIATKDDANGTKLDQRAAAFTAGASTAHTLIVTHNNATFAETFKVDGVLGALTPSGTGTGLIVSMPTVLQLGKLGTVANGFHGYLSDVFVSNDLTSAG